MKDPTEFLRFGVCTPVLVPQTDGVPDPAKLRVPFLVASAAAQTLFAPSVFI